MATFDWFIFSATEICYLFSCTLTIQIFNILIIGLCLERFEGVSKNKWIKKMGLF